jgi:hypothetical protein
MYSSTLPEEMRISAWNILALHDSEKGFETGISALEIRAVEYSIVVFT